MAGIDTKLIIVEGPPYSGKSETACFIADLMEKSRRHVKLFDDNDMNHPADYAFHAFMTEDQIRPMAQEERRQVYEESVKVPGGFVIPLTKISVSLFGKVMPFKIYDKLDWETERPVMLDHWRQFAEKARVNSGITLFNSCFLNTPIGETMIRFDFPYSQIRAYIQEIYQLIEPLNPVVIYLGCSDIRTRIEETAIHKNTVWLNNAIVYHTSQAYGKRLGLSGFNGYIAALKARQETDLKILNDIPVRKLILTDPFDDWDMAYETIAAFVEAKTLKAMKK